MDTYSGPLRRPPAAEGLFAALRGFFSALTGGAAVTVKLVEQDAVAMRVAMRPHWFAHNFPRLWTPRAMGVATRFLRFTRRPPGTPVEEVFSPNDWELMARANAVLRMWRSSMRTGRCALCGKGTMRRTCENASSMSWFRVGFSHADEAAGVPADRDHPEFLREWCSLLARAAHVLDLVDAAFVHGVVEVRGGVCVVLCPFEHCDYAQPVPARHAVFQVLSVRGGGGGGGGGVHGAVT